MSLLVVPIGTVAFVVATIRHAGLWFGPFWTHGGSISNTVPDGDPYPTVQAPLTALQGLSLIQGLEKSVRPTTVLGSIEGAGIFPSDGTLSNGTGSGICGRRLVAEPYLRAHANPMVDTRVYLLAQRVTWELTFRNADFSGSSCRVYIDGARRPTWPSPLLSLTTREQ